MATIAWVKVQGQDEFNQLSRRLKEAGRGDLQRKLVRSVRQEGQPALAAVQRKFRGVHVTTTPSRGGGGSTNLRGRVAAATKIQVTARGIRIRTVGKQVGEYGNTLAQGVNATGVWKHPVFGNRRAWVTQRGQEVFDPTLRGFESRWRAGIVRVMEEVAREIEG
jgi:hypothetical protein